MKSMLQDELADATHKVDVGRSSRTNDDERYPVIFTTTIRTYDSIPILPAPEKQEKGTDPDKASEEAADEGPEEGSDEPADDDADGPVEDSAEEDPDDGTDEPTDAVTKEPTEDNAEDDAGEATDEEDRSDRTSQSVAGTK